jgi:hypothetical protein
VEEYMGFSSCGGVREEIKDRGTIEKKTELGEKEMWD